MEKTKVTVIHDVDGYLKIELEGHTKTEVCIGLSAITNTAVLGIMEIAKQFPDQVDLEVKRRDE